MKAAVFDYVAPRDVSEALSALCSGEGAKLLAGGQSLGPMLNLRLARPRLLIDISRIDSLRTIEQRGQTLWIGAATTHAQIEDETDGMLQAVASGIAYRSIRNRGTIGGSVAHADPAADWPLALAALGATIHIRGSAGTRVINASEFMIGAFTTVLDETELIEAVEVPRPSASARWGYYKFSRKTGDFPEASSAIFLDPERRVANIFIGALNGPPRRCEELAKTLARGDAIAPASYKKAIADTGELDEIELRMQATTLMRAVAQATAS